MTVIWTIAKKEFKQILLSIGAVTLSIYFVYIGFMFFKMLSQFVRPDSLIVKEIPSYYLRNLNVNIHLIQPFQGILFSFGLFIIPLITMKSFAEEKRNKTINILLCAPISSLEIVLGKFMGVVLMILLLLSCSLLFLTIPMIWGEVEYLPLLSGYLGVFLLFCSFGSVGLYFSSLFESQILAAVLSSFLILFFWLLNQIVSFENNLLASFVRYLAYGEHTINMIQGVLYLSDLLYFCFFIAIFLFFTTKNIEAQKWR